MPKITTRHEVRLEPHGDRAFHRHHRGRLKLPGVKDNSQNKTWQWIVEELERLQKQQADK